MGLWEQRGKGNCCWISERVEREPAKDKKERKRKVMEKNVQLGNRRLDNGRTVDQMLEEVELETQVEDGQVENQMEEIVFDGDTHILV